MGVEESLYVNAVTSGCLLGMAVAFSTDNVVVGLVAGLLIFFSVSTRKRVEDILTRLPEPPPSKES